MKLSFVQMIATALGLRGGRRVTIASNEGERSLNMIFLIRSGIGIKASSAQCTSHRQVFPYTTKARGSSDQDTQMRDIFSSVTNLWCDLTYITLPLFVSPLIKMKGTTLFWVHPLLLFSWEVSSLATHSVRYGPAWYKDFSFLKDL